MTAFKKNFIKTGEKKKSQLCLICLFVHRALSKILRMLFCVCLSSFHTGGSDFLLCYRRRRLNVIAPGFNLHVKQKKPQLHRKQLGRVCPSQGSEPSLTVNSGQEVLKVQLSVALCGVLLVYSWLVWSPESLYVTLCRGRKGGSGKSHLVKFVRLLVAVWDRLPFHLLT